MRTLQLLTMALTFTVLAGADTFNITFDAVATFHDDRPAPQIFFTGTVETDGACDICSIAQEGHSTTTDGIDSIVTNVAFYALGPGGIDYDGDSAGAVTLDVNAETLSGYINSGGVDETLYFGLSSPECAGSDCVVGPMAYLYIAGGDGGEIGTYSILSTAAVPEPSALLLLAAVIGLCIPRLTAARTRRWSRWH